MDDRRVRTIKILKKIRVLKRAVDAMRPKREFGDLFYKCLRRIVQLEEKIAPTAAQDPEYYKFNVGEEMKNIDDDYRWNDAARAHWRLFGMGRLPKGETRIRSEIYNERQIEVHRLIILAEKCNKSPNSTDILEKCGEWNRAVIMDNLQLFERVGYPLPYKFDKWKNTNFPEQ